MLTLVRRFSYYDVLRRHNYVTPNSYLELIKTFKILANKKRRSVLSARNRYLTGLEKLDFAATQVLCRLSRVRARKNGLLFRWLSCKKN